MNISVVKSKKFLIGSGVTLLIAIMVVYGYKANDRKPDVRVKQDIIQPMNIKDNEKKEDKEKTRRYSGKVER
jgi:hypothetical protein